MKALILGTQIVQLADAEFPVAPSLTWVDVPPDTTTLDTWVNGALVKYTPPPPPPPHPRMVDAERNRRMGTFVFNGKAYDLEGQSLANVSGAGTLALAAIMQGAQPNDLRWADPNVDFHWIANDNTLTPMDAQTCWAFAQTAAAWRKHCIFKARAIKDMNPIPQDFSSDSYWAL